MSKVSLLAGTAFASVLAAIVPVGAADMPEAFFTGDTYVCPETAPADTQGLLQYQLHGCQDQTVQTLGAPADPVITGGGGGGGGGGNGGNPNNPPNNPPPNNPPPNNPPPENPPPGGRANNGVGNGLDQQPPGNPPINDGPGTAPGMPGNQGGATPGGQGNPGGNSP